MLVQGQDIPDCVVQALLKTVDTKGKLTDADYHLAGAGRALAFTRMAADALAVLGNEQRVAEYHAYAGISAARTAIDATASWLRLALEVQVKSLSQVDLKRKDYEKKVIEKLPTLKPYTQALGNLAQVIDEHRQRAQHREGLALRFHSTGEKVVHPGGWYLQPLGSSASGKTDIRLVDLLSNWEKSIEQNVCLMVTEVLRV